MELLGFMLSLFFLRNYQIDFQSDYVYHFTFLSVMHEGFNFSVSLSTHGIEYIFMMMIMVITIIILMGV